jgi:hypothetical protein
MHMVEKEWTYRSRGMIYKDPTCGEAIGPSLAGIVEVMVRRPDPNVLELSSPWKQGFGVSRPTSKYPDPRMCNPRNAPMHWVAVDVVGHWLT